MHMQTNMIASSLDFPCVYVTRGFLCVIGQAKTEIHQNHSLISKSILKKEKQITTQTK